VARTGRTERGRVTSARIVAAARRLFLERGYVDTTMAAIASEAGVAVQSLYLSFGSKIGILSACHDVSVVGDDEPVPVLERPWVGELRRAKTAREALAIMLDNTLDIVDRVAPIQAVVRSAAADPEVARLQAGLKDQRLATLRTLAEVVASKKGFGNLPLGRAADILYTLVSEELHALLVLDRGWDVSEWKNWVRDTLAERLLVPDEHGASRAKAPTRNAGPPSPR
jgi:AcrR family transcriptional regulator